MTDRRKPENAELRQQIQVALKDRTWLTVNQYIAMHGISRSTLYKWESAGLIVLHRICPKGQTKPMVRVENKPPTS